MKKLQRFYNILMWLPLATTVISLFFLPPQVVAHYGKMGDNRYESKYFLLILPFFCILLGAFLKIMVNDSLKSGKDKNSKTPVLSGVITMLIMDLVHGILLVSAFLYANNVQWFSSIHLSSNHIMALSCFFVALLLAVIGISCFFHKKPVGIYSNVEAPDSSKVKDLKKYNQAVGKLLLGYSVPFFYCTFLALSDTMAATIILILSGMPGCIIIIAIYECVIDKKYIRHG